jgi:hypothetical protein
LTTAPDDVAQQSPTPTLEDTPAGTATPAAETTAETAPESDTAAADATGAPDAETPTTPKTTPEPTPTTQVYLVRGDGIRLLADETLLFIQRTTTGEHKTIAVLGTDNDALSAGLTRLMSRDLTNCLIQDELVICPYAPDATGGGATPTSTPEAGAAAPPDKGSGDSSHSEDGALILIVDDDRNAVEGGTLRGAADTRWLLADALVDPAERLPGAGCTQQFHLGHLERCRVWRQWRARRGATHRR